MSGDTWVSTFTEQEHKYCWNQDRNFQLRAPQLNSYLQSSLARSPCISNSNPFVPSVLNRVRLTKIYNFNLRRDLQKNFLWASHLWVGRWKEPLLSYVTRNDEKKESGHKWVKPKNALEHFFNCNYLYKRPYQR